MTTSRRHFILALPSVGGILVGASAPAASSNWAKVACPHKWAAVRYKVDKSKAVTALVSNGVQQSAVPVGLARIRDLVEKYMIVVARAPEGLPGEGEVYSLSRQLYAALWKPIESAVHPGATAYVSGEDFLRQFPFESLYDGETFLGQKLKLEYLPDSWNGQRVPQKGWSPLAGNRGIVYAPGGKIGGKLRMDAQMVEARRIPYLLPKIKWTARLGENATKAQYLVDTATPFSILHVATHGVSEAGTTKLVLSKDKTDPSADASVLDLLAPSEIERRHLQGRLVVLAACDSGAANKYGSTLNLGDAFLAAGVQEVVAARWKVDDLATAEFMRTFYLNLAHGHRTACSLRAARTSLIISSYLPLRHPYFWSPFFCRTNTLAD